MAKAQRVAVLGAGMQGTCVALELASRGCAVDLYDLAAEPLTGVAVNNEGKIHLGLVYAKDPSLATARCLLAGALRFASSLRRWIPFRPESAGVTSSSTYAVLADSMLPLEALRAHYRAVGELYRQAVAAAPDCSYLDQETRGEPLVRELEPGEREDLFDGERIVAAFATGERTVDPRRVAAMLRQALADNPHVRVVDGARVVGARPARRGVEVDFWRQGALASEPYDQAVNALWAWRLPVDLSAGLRPSRPWIFRHRSGFLVRLRAGATAVAPVTFVLGPYGDAISYPGGDLYLSWYTACLTAVAHGLAPPDTWEVTTTPADRFAGVLSGLASLSHAVRRLTPADILAVTEVGGWIMAPGEEDIHHPASALHRRDNPGVCSRGRYHSVDTGKYSMAPWLAVRVADRVLGDEPRR